MNEVKDCHPEEARLSVNALFEPRHCQTDPPSSFSPVKPSYFQGGRHQGLR